jgi:tetratricopeptide (TPR) repeat protein
LKVENNVAKQSEISATLSVIEKKRTELRHALTDFAESLSKFEPKLDSQIKALEAFNRGDVSRARELLQNEIPDIEEGRARIAEKSFEISQANSAFSSHYLLLAQATAADFSLSSRISSAEFYYKASIECTASYKNLFAYAKFLYEHSKLHAAIDFWTRALAIARDSKDRIREAHCYNNLGVVNRNLGELQTAMHFHELSFEISKDSSRSSDRLGSLINLGSLNGILGGYKKASLLYKEALKIARQNKNRQAEGRVLSGVGLIYLKWGKYEKSVKFQKDALLVLREIGDRRGEGYCLCNLGNVYDALKEYESAEGCYKKSLKIDREIGYLHGEGKNLVNLGAIYKKMNKIEMACKYWTQALLIYETIGLAKAEEIREWMKEIGCPE